MIFSSLYPKSTSSNTSIVTSSESLAIFIDSKSTNSSLSLANSDISSSTLAGLIFDFWICFSIGSAFSSVITFALEISSILFKTASSWELSTPLSKVVLWGLGVSLIGALVSFGISSSEDSFSSEMLFLWFVKVSIKEK